MRDEERRTHSQDRGIADRWLGHPPPKQNAILQENIAYVGLYAENVNMIA